MRTGQIGVYRHTRAFASLATLLAVLIAGSVLSPARARSEDVKAPAPEAAEAHDISALVTHMDDLEAAVRVTKYEAQELEKIGSDFKTTYAIRTLTLQYKQPGKLRLEGKSPTRGNALMILNGATRYYAIPKFHLKKTEDLGASPGKRQSLLEYGGLIVPDTLQFMQGRFVRAETIDGTPTSVFDMTYQGATGGTHYRLWIDPRTRVAIKRIWFDGENKIRATFLYTDIHELAPGVWLPGRVEIRNAEDIVSAEIALIDVKVNQNLPDSLFDVTR